MSGDRESADCSSDDVSRGDDWISLALAIPLVALLIPLAGVAGGFGFGGVFLGTVGGVIGLLVLSSVAKGLMALRHAQRLEILDHQIRLAREETARLAEVNRVVYHQVEG